MSGNLIKRRGTWYFRAQIDGRDIRRSLRTPSRAEALKRLPKIQAEVAHLRFYGEERHTWRDAAVGWSRQGGLRPSTLRRYAASLKQVDAILGGLYVDQVDTKAIARISRRAGVTNATRRRDLTAVSVVLRWCVAQQWCESNPARAWDRSVIKERREPVRLPEPADIDCVVARAPANFGKLIRLAQYTGMREEEIASLERPQIDLRRAAATLTRTKTNRPRSVPLDERALGTLAGTPAHLGSAFVFWHGADGARYLNVATRFAKIVLSAQARARKEKRPVPRRFRFHDLRHWFAVDYLRRGGSIYRLKQVLGHSSIKTTELYLDYLTPDEQERAKEGAA